MEVSGQLDTPAALPPIICFKNPKICGKSVLGIKCEVIFLSICPKDCMLG
jgi:hypothetical protein